MAKKITTLGDLTPDPNNARRHTPRNVGQIETAIGKVGTGRSIVIDEDGVVLAGNATIDAAAAAGLTRVQVVDSDGETIIAVRRTGLTPEQKTQLALYDNRAAELAEWDPAVLAAIDAEHPDMLADLWRPEELVFVAEYLASAGADQTDDDDDEQGKRDLLALLDITIAPPRHEVHNGQVWQLGGRHSLVICGLLRDWPQWAPLLDGDDAIFLPYPGVLSALTEAASRSRLVMVQPNRYLAGHLLDRYEDINGAGSVILA